MYYLSRSQIRFGFFPDIEAMTWCYAAAKRSICSPLVFSAAPSLTNVSFCDSEHRGRQSSSDKLSGVTAKRGLCPPMRQAIRTTRGGHD